MGVLDGIEERDVRVVLGFAFNGIAHDGASDFASFVTTHAVGD
jgi:hypothetical protein